MYYIHFYTLSFGTLRTFILRNLERSEMLVLYGLNLSLRSNFMDFPLQNYPGDASVLEPANQEI
jgi:hypothetical protein